MNPLSVEGCGAARTNAIRVLPTALAPDGLVRITARSSARCKVAGAAHSPTATADYRAEVEYWRWTPTVPAVPEVLADVLNGILFSAGLPAIPGYGSYVSAGVITEDTITDPLASVNPATIPVSDTETLADYIESWAGLTTAGIQKSQTDNVASLTVPAVVTVQTKPVRGAGDPASVVSLAVGAASCYAEDNR